MKQEYLEGGEAGRLLFSLLSHPESGVRSLKSFVSFFFSESWVSQSVSSKQQIYICLKFVIWTGVTLD